MQFIIYPTPFLVPSTPDTRFGVCEVEEIEVCLLEVFETLGSTGAGFRRHAANRGNPLM